MIDENMGTEIHISTELILVEGNWYILLNDVDNEIVGVLKSWALVRMSWPKITSPFWIIHSRSGVAMIGRGRKSYDQISSSQG